MCQTSKKASFPPRVVSASASLSQEDAPVCRPVRSLPSPGLAPILSPSSVGLVGAEVRLYTGLMTTLELRMGTGNWVMGVSSIVSLIKDTGKTRR